MTWILPRLTDYWDQQSGATFDEGAIYRLSRRLVDLEREAFEGALTSIRKAVVQHCAALDERALATAAFCFAEDLYRAITQSPVVLDDAGRAYLAASGGTFSQQLEQRGFVVHYVIDNTFELTPLGMRGPLSVFPQWFPLAGFEYVCPQLTAFWLMNDDGVDVERRADQLEDYINGGRATAFESVRTFQEARRSYVYLDTDATDGSFSAPVQQFGQPGVIGLFRQEAPTKGSRCRVVLPDEPFRG